MENKKKFYHIFIDFSFNRLWKLLATTASLLIVFDAVTMYLLPKIWKDLSKSPFSKIVLVMFLQSFIITGLSIVFLEILYKKSFSKKYLLLKLSKFLFSAKTQEDIFEQIIVEWNEEIYKILEEKKDANLFMINVRNTYAFLAAMWMKSPIGDLIEFIRKFAK